MDRRKYLRAYVRTDKRGKIVPGSLALLKKQPRTPGFKEVTDPGVNSCYCSEITCGQNWIDSFFLTGAGGYNTGEGGDIFPSIDPVNNAIDSSCNMYNLQDSEQFNIGEYNDPVFQWVHILTKTSPAGALLWQKVFYYTFEQTPIPINARRIDVDSEGNCYILGPIYITKFNSDGVLLWTKFYNVSYQEDVNFFADMVIATGDIPVITGRYFDYRTFVATVDPATGNLATKKVFGLAPNPIYGSLVGPYTIAKDNFGHIYAQIVSQDPDYCTTLIKLDMSLTPIWSKVTDVNLSTWVGDADSTDIETDGQGNIYLNGYGAEIYKLNPDGETQWTTLFRYTSNDNEIYHPITSVSTNGTILSKSNTSTIGVDTNGNWLFAYDMYGTYVFTLQTDDRLTEIYYNSSLIGGDLAYDLGQGARYSVLFGKLPITDLSGVATPLYYFSDAMPFYYQDNTSNIVMSDIAITEEVPEGPAQLTGYAVVDFPANVFTVTTDLIP